jgi:hypothetical protein
MRDYWEEDIGEIDERPTMALIAGCDRSGTHLLAKLLTTPETAVYKEVEPIFGYSIAMARNHERKLALMPRLVECYKKAIDEHGDRLFIDKSHMNMWILGELREHFNIKVIAIRRNAFSVVRSMASHRGVILDCLFSQAWTHPNPFMGIIDEEYDEMTLLQKMVYKWKAHEVGIKALVDHDEARVVTYEHLLEDTPTAMLPVIEYLGLTDYNRMVVIDDTRSDAWKQELHPDHVGEISLALAEWNEKEEA